MSVNNRIIETENASIFITQFESYWDDNLLQQKLKQLPINLQHDIVAYKSNEAKQLRIGGKHLLKYGIEYLEIEEENVLEKLTRTKYNKPFLSNDFDFSITHAYPFVICAIAKHTSIGIDIEKITQVDVSLYQNYLCKQEQEWLDTSTNKTHDFFICWTKKEAILKAIGIGTTANLNEINTLQHLVVYDNKTLACNELKIHSDFVCHYAIVV